MVTIRSFKAREWPGWTVVNGDSGVGGEPGWPERDRGEQSQDQSSSNPNENSSNSGRVG